ARCSCRPTCRSRNADRRSTPRSSSARAARRTSPRRCCSSSTTISSPASASPWTGDGRPTRRTAWGDARQPIPDPGPVPFWEAFVETTFKAAGHADIDVLLVLRREFCRHQEIAFDEQRAEVALARLLDDQSLGRVWLIGSGGATVGYVVLIFSYSLE